MAPPIIEPVWCVTRLKRSTSTSCRCPATAPTSCRSRRSGAGSARVSPIITVIPPPRISAGEWPLSRSASIRTPAPSPIASGSKITSTLTKKNYASQTRRGLDVAKTVLQHGIQDGRGLGEQTSCRLIAGMKQVQPASQGNRPNCLSEGETQGDGWTPKRFEREGTVTVREIHSPKVAQKDIGAGLLRQECLRLIYGHDAGHLVAHHADHACKQFAGLERSETIREEASSSPEVPSSVS